MTTPLESRVAWIEGAQEQISIRLAENTAAINALRIELKGDIGELRAELKGNIGGLQSQVNSLGQILTEVQVTQAAILATLQSIQQSQQETLKNRRFIIGAAIALAGVVIAALAAFQYLP